MLLVTLVVLTSLLPAVPAQERPEQVSLMPTLTISPLNPSSASVNITKEHEASTQYTATVTVTKPPLIGTVTVQLDSSCSCGYLTAVDPQTITFTSPGSVEVTITVVVPQSADAGACRVLLTGIATYPGGSRTAMAYGTLMVEPYFGISGLIKTVTGSGNPLEYHIIVVNDGNANDTFQIEVLQRTKWENEGMSLSLSRSETVEMGPTMNDTIRLKIDYDVSTGPGKRKMTIRVTSKRSLEGDGENETYLDLPLEADVQALGGGTAATYTVIGGVIVVAVVVIVLFYLVLKRRGRRTGVATKARKGEVEGRGKEEKKGGAGTGEEKEGE